MNAKRWWGVTYINSSEVMPDTIARTRREAMKACCDRRYQFRDDPDDWMPAWKEWHKRGCRAVRVIVQREDTKPAERADG
jgi:hypothetical protein